MDFHPGPALNHCWAANKFRPGSAARLMGPLTGRCVPSRSPEPLPRPAESHRVPPRPAGRSPVPLPGAIRLAAARDGPDGWGCRPDRREYLGWLMRPASGGAPGLYLSRADITAAQTDAAGLDNCSIRTADRGGRPDRQHVHPDRQCQQLDGRGSSPAPSCTCCVRRVLMRRFAPGGVGGIRAGWCTDPRSAFHALDVEPSEGLWDALWPR